MNWFEKMISIDEFRISSLVLVLAVVVTAIIVAFFITGNVDHLLIALAETLIYSIAGVNVVSGITTTVTNKNQWTSGTSTSVGSESDREGEEEEVHKV